MWALGNISGDSVINRDLILKTGGLNPLIKLLESTTNQNIRKQATGTLFNLCRGTPLPQFELVKNAIGPLARVLKEEEDIEMLADSAWAISYLSGMYFEMLFMVF